MVIVGAWLAVLVPMALRSHDAATSQRSAERFGNAMRVLSPRSARRAAPTEQVQAFPGDDAGAFVPRQSALEPLLRAFREERPRPPLTLVARRRRVLLALLSGAGAGLLGGLLSGWLLLVGLVLLGLAVAYVVHLRRLAVQRAAAARRRWDEPDDDLGWDARDDGYGWDDQDGRTAQQPAWDDWVPARLPQRAPAAARATPARRYEDPLPLAVGDDAGWSPVPVPPPVYVGKSVAPRRPPRVLDLTEPGRWSDAVTAGELGDAPDLELDDILDGRRAVGDW